MIKLEAAHIEEVRGIRKLDIDFQKCTFAISGPNGSGKSGVIDAIEFGLTAEIGRLAGRGTRGLTVTEHGPHVDKAKFPDAAFVKLRVFFPKLKRSATIIRKLSTPRKPTIDPPDREVTLLGTEVVAIRGLITLATQVAREQGDWPCTTLLSEWNAELDNLRTALTSTDGLTGVKDRLSGGWLGTPPDFSRTN